MPRTRSARILLLTPALLLFGIAGCGPTLLESTRCDRTVTIDGIDTGSEWENAQYTFDDKKVTLGLMHDDSHLYLRLSTRDRATQAQVIMGGLTVWFNTSGKKDKTMGVRYPVPVTERSMARPPMQEGDAEPPAPGDRNSGAGTVRQMMMETLTSVEFIGPHKEDRTAMTCNEADSLGVKARIGFMNGNLVYELRMPLRKDAETPYAVSGDAVSGFVGIGFETGKFAMARRDSGQGGRGGQGRRGGGIGGGMSGGIGGGMSGMGGAQGGAPGGRQDQESPQTVELWVKARLGEIR